MKTTARVILFLVAAFFLFPGLRLMFDPSGALAGLGVGADSTIALSNVRAMFGGAITAIGVCVLIAAITCNIWNARPAVIFVLAVVVGRIAGLALDGFDKQAAMFTAVPIVVLILLIVAHKLLDKAAEPSQA